jgi:hypothetical protein
MLKDTTLNFDHRSAVDLKDRQAHVTPLNVMPHAHPDFPSFRTYFPDAYKQHYPNAKTHLSSKVRSTLPDGSPLFEKTRGKKRRPFTPEEDAALRAGYDAHGTVWATIVKDPAFRAQGRKSTDLRDRFRNAFPELYQAAGYKPRTSAKKKLGGHTTGLTEDVDGLGLGSELSGGLAGLSRGVRRTQDDQVVGSGRRVSGPIRRRRALTNEGLSASSTPVVATTTTPDHEQTTVQAGSRSVPQSSTNSDDDEAERSEDEEDYTTNFRQRSSTSKLAPIAVSAASSSRHAQAPAQVSSPSGDMDTDIAPVDDFLASSLLSESSWPIRLDTQVHSQSQSQPQSLGGMPWATHGGIGSPSPSHIGGSEYFRAVSSNDVHAHVSPLQRPSLPIQAQSQPNQPTQAQAQSQVQPQRHSHIQTAQQQAQPATIGRSAWQTQDWLMSANPRLEHTSSGTGGASSSASSSFAGFSPVPSSPFSLASGSGYNGFTGLGGGMASSMSHQSHGVMDRYDLPGPAYGYGGSLGGGYGLGHGHGGSLGHSYDDHDVHDFASELGPGDTHSAFSDPDSFGGGFGPAGFKGFTHHSTYAGDLIFGARTHQPLAAGSGHAFGFGGLGLSGMSSGQGQGQGQQVHRSFSGTHTPALPGIDEAALGAISLEDPVDVTGEGYGLDSLMADYNIDMSGINSYAHPQDGSHPHSHPHSHLHGQNHATDALEQLINLPPADPDGQISMGLAAPDAMHISPPGTPVERSRRVLRTQSGFESQTHTQSRSVSVPPAEHRNPALLAAPTAPVRPPLTPTRSMSLLEPLSGGGTHAHYPSVTSIVADGMGSYTLSQSSTSISTSPSAPMPTSGWSSSNNAFDFATSSNTGATSDPYSTGLRYVPGHHPEIPFLDLHYYSTGHTPAPDASFGWDTSTQHAGSMGSSGSGLGQASALDLATFASPLHSHSYSQVHSPQLPSQSHSYGHGHGHSQSLSQFFSPSVTSVSSLSSLSHALSHSHTHTQLQPQAYPNPLKQHVPPPSQPIGLPQYSFGSHPASQPAVRVNAHAHSHAHPLTLSPVHGQGHSLDSALGPGNNVHHALGEGQGHGQGHGHTHMHGYGHGSGPGQIISLSPTQSQMQVPTQAPPTPPTASRHTFHHRGQSAVSPQDLMLRSDDTRRKRMSWDGGPP